MAQVTVTIAGKTYRMACDDGQEEHLLGLARRLDLMIDELRGVFGEIGDQRLTVMSAITVLDRLAEAERRLAATDTTLARVTAERDDLGARLAERETVLAARVAGAAEAVERLADRLAGS